MSRTWPSHQRPDPGPAAFIKVGTCKSDPGKDPAEFEWSLVPGAPTSLGIYKVEGDTLTLCSDGPGGKRPDKFEVGGRA